MELQGKVALVTGASRGIGAAVARKLAAEGFNVAIGYERRHDQAQEVVDSLTEAGVQAISVAADVSDEVQIERLVKTVAEWSGGRIDTLICCAGVEEFRPLNQIKAAHFQRIFSINALGPLLCTMAAVEYMPPGSSVVWTSSVAAARAVDRHALYAGSKAAMDTMARQVAGELAPQGIRINVCAPGGTDTEMSREHASNYLEKAYIGIVPIEKLAEAKTALGRWAHPDEVAETIAFLVSDRASYMTGSTLQVDGGFR